VTHEKGRGDHQTVQLDEVKEGSIVSAYRVSPRHRSQGFGRGHTELGAEYRVEFLLKSKVRRRRQGRRWSAIVRRLARAVSAANLRLGRREAVRIRTGEAARAQSDGRGGGGGATPSSSSS
jgi:hypothetical protein